MGGVRVISYILQIVNSDLDYQIHCCHALKCTFN